MTEGEWCNPASKRSHHRKNYKKRGTGQKNGGLGKRGLGLSAPFDPTPRPVSHISKVHDSGGGVPHSGGGVPHSHRNRVGAGAAPRWALAQSHGGHAEPSGPKHSQLFDRKYNLV